MWQLNGSSLTIMQNVTSGVSGKPVNVVAWSPSGELLATGSDVGIQVYRMLAASSKLEWSAPIGSVVSLTYSSDGLRLLATSANKTIFFS